MNGAREHGAPSQQVEGAEAFACTPAQVQFWLEEQFVPRDPALHVNAVWQIDGELDHGRLEEAWHRLIDRHDALRVSIVVRAGEPMQLVAPRVPFAIPCFDLRDLAEAERFAEIARLGRIAARTPFAIERPPLVRVTRLLTAAQSSLLVVTVHALAGDRVSLDILRAELEALLVALHAGAVCLLPNLGGAYRDVATGDRQRTAPEALAVERERVREVLHGWRQFELPTDHARPRLRTSNADVARVTLAHAAEPPAALLAALFALLYRFSGETDILLCTDVDDRVDGNGRIVGAFTTTIPLRADLSGNPSLRTLRERVHTDYARAVATRIPLAQTIELARPVRDSGRTPVFGIRVTFASALDVAGVAGAAPLTVSEVPGEPPGVRYDLDFDFARRPDGLRISCVYNADLFEAGTVDVLLDALRTLLVDAARNPEAPIDSLEIVSAAERAALLAANPPPTPYPQTATVLDLFAQRVALMPDRVAVRCADAAYTYAQLEAAADTIARRVLAVGPERGARVGILLDRSCEMLAALLGVLKAGCAYVPLDPSYPADRLAFIAADSALCAVITRSASAADALGTAGVARIVVDGPASLLVAPTPLPALPAPGPTDIAYVIYTSGSTGRPKGVAVPHGALVNLLCAMSERPGIGAADTLVAVTTISFDIAGLELFLPLIAGATVVIAREDQIVDGAALLDLLTRARATLMQATPVTWQLLLDAGWRGEPALRMLCGGEALPRALAERLLACGPDLWNMYGPTETTIWSSVLRVTPGTGAVPIGPPIANTTMHVVDPQGRLVPRGVPGELVIGGAGVAAGYYERPQLTRERFIPDPFVAEPGARLYRTGDIVRRRGDGFTFLGRADHQVKLRGFRIELDEIAAALLRAPEVAESAAIVGGPSGGESLRAYVVPVATASVDPVHWPAVLRDTIAASLPAYMLPATITVLDRLPRTPNGKLDRTALPEAAPAAPGAAAAAPPATPTEVVVAALAAPLLSRESVDRRADLFALGLHSLSAVRLIAAIEERTGVRLAVRTVFDGPTIAAIAAAVDGGRASSAAPEGPEPIVRYNAGGSAPPLIFFHNDAHAAGLYCRRIAAELGPEQPLIALAPHGSAGLPLLTTIEAMAADHVARLKAVQPHGPYHLGGHCYGALVAFEAARLLRERGDDVVSVLVSNVYAPIRGWAIVDAALRRVGLDETLAADRRERICADIACLAHSSANGGPAALRYVAARVRSLLRTGARERQSRNELAHPEILLRPGGAAEDRRRLTDMVARCTYHPGAYDGPVTLVWSSDEPPATGDPTAGDPTMGWCRLARSVRVVPIAGTHVGLIRERVDEFARLLRIELQRKAEPT